MASAHFVKSFIWKIQQSRLELSINKDRALVTGFSLHGQRRFYSLKREKFTKNGKHVWEIYSPPELHGKSADSKRQKYKTDIKIKVSSDGVLEDFGEELGKNRYLPHKQPEECVFEGAVVLVFRLYSLASSRLENVKSKDLPEDENAISLSLERTFGAAKFTDVLLKCGDKQYGAHVALLSARSPVFAAMFRHDMSETRNRLVDIPDIEPDILGKLLAYIYTGKVFDMQRVDTAIELYRAADKYDVRSLKHICAAYLEENLTAENVDGVQELADLFDDLNLKTAVHSFQQPSQLFGDLFD